MNPNNTTNKKSATATTSLILGVVSLSLMALAGVLFFFPFIAIVPFALATVGALVGLILGIVAVVKRGLSVTARTMATIGIVLNLPVGVVGIYILILGVGYL